MMAFLWFLQKICTMFSQEVIVNLSTANLVYFANTENAEITHFNNFKVMETLNI